MNFEIPHLQIRLYGTNGSTRMFTQNNSELANRTLVGLDPAKLFAADTVKLADDDSEATHVVSDLTRIDLLTDYLSVWDFPFVLGTPVELTESEFQECLGNPQRWQSPGWRSDTPVFLALRMLKGQQYFLWMEVVGGLSAVRMSRIRSMLKARSLVFGLRTGGIGVLNLANLLRFSIHPEPVDAVAETSIHSLQE